MRGELQNQRTQVHLVLKTFHTRCNKRNRLVPMSVSYKAPKANQKLRYRCRPGCCGYLRKTKTDLDVDDIDAEDKAATELPVDDEGDESDGAQDAAAAAQEILQVSQGDDELPERDVQGGFGPSNVKDVFAYADSTAFYESVFSLGGAGAQQTCYLLSTTAHPSGWLVMRQHCSDVHVFHPRASEHSMYHGKMLGAEFFLADRLKHSERAKKRLILKPEASFMLGPNLETHPQVISAFDVASGSNWYDGLNSAVWDPEKLQMLEKDLVAAEMDTDMFLVTPPRAERGRGILVQQSYREGDKIGNLACLWFDQVRPILLFEPCRRVFHCPFPPSQFDPLSK